jgi:hypothetical protein
MREKNANKMADYGVGEPFVAHDFRRTVTTVRCQDAYRTKLEQRAPGRNVVPPKSKVVYSHYRPNLHRPVTC